MKNGLITNRRCLPYNPKLKQRARNLRNNSTKAEIKMWVDILRNRQTGFQFYRQKPLYHFIVDFYCPKLKLVIEIDGGSHNEKIEYDRVRTELLNVFDLDVIRYRNEDVMKNIEGVRIDLMNRIQKSPLHSPFEKGGSKSKSDSVPL